MGMEHNIDAIHDLCDPTLRDHINTNHVPIRSSCCIHYTNGAAI